MIIENEHDINFIFFFDHGIGLQLGRGLLFVA
jgi:hypothetical protein